MYFTTIIIVIWAGIASVKLYVYENTAFNYIQVDVR